MLTGAKLFIAHKCVTQACVHRNYFNGRGRQKEGRGGQGTRPIDRDVEHMSLSVVLETAVMLSTGEQLELYP